jgi:hypothetical protein
VRTAKKVDPRGLTLVLSTPRFKLILQARTLLIRVLISASPNLAPDPSTL